MTWYKRFK